MINLLKAILPIVTYLKPIYDYFKEFYDAKQNETSTLRALVNAAMEELKHNANPRIGDKASPFLLKNIGMLIEYCGSNELNEENKEQFRQYRLHATECNSGKITTNSIARPGRVQNRSKELCVILEQALSKL